MHRDVSHHDWSGDGCVKFSAVGPINSTVGSLCMVNAAPRFPCPCCGYIVFDEPPGSYDICPICFWEDDISQLRFPTTTGANHPNLIEAQENYAREGVCESRLQDHVRVAVNTDVRDVEWRPIDESKDNIEELVVGVDEGNKYPDDATQLYYWRQGIWRV